MHRLIKNWAIFIAGTTVMAGIGHLIDGPSAHEVEKAQAADAIDASAGSEVQLISKLTRECHKLRGPGAALMQVRGTDDYVCRESEIEPTPAEFMQRYALLGSQR